MKTLYDLLEALPRDDAEGLRAAFRRAVKGAHPDLRPGDPDAALKFRQIVHANEILGDPDQRAAYDDLLEIARWEHESAYANPAATRINKVTSGVIALAGAAVVTAGAYLLFMHMSAAAVTWANDAGAPRAARPPSNAESVAFIDPGSAPQLNPTLLPAYVDHGMIAYRARKANHVFPDATANRIEKVSPSKPAPTVGKQPRLDPLVTARAVRPLSPRRTAARDLSRNEGFASAMLR